MAGTVLGASSFNIIADPKFPPPGTEALTITRCPAATDVTFRVEVSTNLSSWSETPTVIEHTSPASLIVRDAMPIETQLRRYLRLTLTLQP